MDNYKSSIVNLYGYPEKIPNDSKVIKEIIDRQGVTFLLHCIAEYYGESNLKFNYNNKEKSILLERVLTELKESINERW